MLYYNTTFGVKPESTDGTDFVIDIDAMFASMLAELDSEPTPKTTDILDQARDKSSTEILTPNLDNTHINKLFAELDQEACLVATLSPFHAPVIAPPHTPSSHPLSSTHRYETLIERICREHKEKSASLSLSKTSTDPILTGWRNLTAPQIFNFSTRTAERAGGLAFSLNLSDQVEKSAAATRDPAAFMAARITRSLKASGLAGLPFALTLEATHLGRLHLHGVIILGDADLEQVKRALMNAGGKLPGRSASRQLSLTVLTDALGWAGYCAKDENRTRREVAGNRLIFISRTMNALAKTLHQSNKPKPDLKILHNSPKPPKASQIAPHRHATVPGTLSLSKARKAPHRPAYRVPATPQPVSTHANRKGRINIDVAGEACGHFLDTG